MVVDLPSGRQGTLSPADKQTVLYSTIFRVSTLQGSAEFGELGGIVSEIEQTEYMEAGPVGAMFSRHAGRSKPPTVTLRRAMRTGPSTTWLWTWHQAARSSLPAMHRDCVLELFSAGDSLSGMPRMTYILFNAWPAKIELGGVKAGGTEVLVQTVVIQCDELIDGNVV
jgi:phage tail-like protein